MSADVDQVLTHECPAVLCTEQIDPDMLLCPRHWYQVPGPLRRAVWIAWHRGAGVGTPRTPGRHDRGNSGGEPCLSPAAPRGARTTTRATTCITA